MSAARARFAQLLRDAERVLVFTGAGISTGSSIPDFRGPDGVWRFKEKRITVTFIAPELLGR